MSLPLEAWLALISAIVGMVSTFLKSFKFVKEGEKGVRLRFGKAVRKKDGQPDIVNPGFVFLIPWVDSLPRHHVRQQTIRFDRQRIMLNDGLVFYVTAIVIFRVIDVYKVMFEIDDLDGSLEDLAMGILRDELAARAYTELGSHEISRRLVEHLRETSQAWGIELLEFRLVDCAPTSETANLLNAEVGARLRSAALGEAAKSFGIRLGDLSPLLGAVLVGTPLVASITDTDKVVVGVKIEDAPDKEEPL